MHTKFYRDLVQPGEVVLGADSHTSSHGGLGAFAIGLGGADITAAMVLGQTWIEVPEAIAVDYEGATPFGIGGKDIILETLGALGRNTVAMERSVEYRGDAAHNFTTDMRFTICNMTAEFGGLNGIFEAGRAGRRVAGCAAAVATTTPRSTSAPTTTRPTSRATPSTSASLAPQVAKPFSPDNVFAVDELVRPGARRRVHRRLHHHRGGAGARRARAGAGARGRRGAAAGGERTAHRRPRRPDDPEALRKSRASGRSTSAPGFIVDPPNCSMCLGIASRKAGKGEVWLSSQNRNFENRMGEGSLAWLASAATVAASALVDAGRAIHARCWSASTATGWTRILQRQRNAPPAEITTAEPAIARRPQQRAGTQRRRQPLAASSTRECSASATRWTPTRSSPASSAT